ncbi:MAG: aldo/keto reductase [Planctomycetota bacterium]
MKTTTLGRTGLEVSIAGLGCGGHSQLGMRLGLGEDHAVGIVHRAIDQGVTFIDTATWYSTEPIVGRALRELDSPTRERIVVSSKSGVVNDGNLKSGAEYLADLEASLDRLGLDCVDLYHLHGLGLDQYEHAAHEIVPALQRAKEQGKLKHLAVSEMFERDTSHAMFQRALPDNLFDVIMIGFHPLNPSARRTVFPLTQQHNVGTLGMFAVRRALSRPERLREIVDELIDQGRLDADAIDRHDPLSFLGNTMDAGYRFSAHEPGLDVVLFGTSNAEHLDANIASINAEPLPTEQLAQLDKLFGAIDSVSGN